MLVNKVSWLFRKMHAHAKNVYIASCRPDVDNNTGRMSRVIIYYRHHGSI